MTNAAPSTGAFATLEYRYDAISVNEAMNYLFKKSIGYPNTTPQGDLYNEMTDNNNSFPFITINKLYNQPIPESNLPFDNYIFDPSFSNITFNFKSSLYPGRIPPDTNGKRYYSSNYPYIAYYSNILLGRLAIENGTINNGTDDVVKYTRSQVVSYGHPLLVNAIPGTYAPYNIFKAGSYSTILLTSNIENQVRILPRDGYWLIDTDSGIVTLYDSNTNVQLGAIRNEAGSIIGYNLPRISFYRYEGLMGSTNVANTQDF